MGCGNLLVTGFNNFFSFDLKIKISAFLIPVAFFIVIGSAFSGRWSTSESERFGLDTYCYFNNSMTCCKSIKDTFGRRPDWMVGTFVMMMIAIGSSAITFFIIIFTTSVTACSSRRSFQRIIPVASLVTAFILMIAIAIYADKSHSESWSTGTRVSASFVAAVIALIIFLAVGVVNLSQTHRVGDADVYAPSNWTEYTRDKPLCDWISEGKTKVKVTDVTSNEEGSMVHDLFKELWKPNLAGKGRDATEGGYRKANVISIQRIENPMLLEKYLEIRRKLLRRGSTMKKANEFKNSRGNITTTSSIRASFLENNGIDTDINEHYLFHGCPTDIAPLLTQDGLDLRLASKDGMFGQGTYGAENPTKSDQYTGGGFENKKMFLMRVLLGDMYFCQEGYKFQRPPCKICINNDQYEGLCNNESHRNKDDWLFDSVFYDNPDKNKFREFIVYDQHKCYPEYLITYNRVRMQ